MEHEELPITEGYGIEDVTQVPRSYTEESAMITKELTEPLALYRG
jgi:hypothetical protein